MKYIIAMAFLFAATQPLIAQDTTLSKKEARRLKVNNMIRQAEEGVLVYSRQTIFGLEAKTNGYGAFLEIGRMKTNRRTNIYRLEITETKEAKEEKLLTNRGFFGNPLIYGKINYFYPVTLGFGQQYIFGQKGNKNGVAVSGIYHVGLALGLLRPYYVEVRDENLQEDRTIKYSDADSTLFLNGPFYGGGGFGKGWSEITMKPGAYAKVAMRFDYGRFNEVVSGLEIGMSLEAYGSKIPIMLFQKDRNLFFQGYIALLFGRRK